MTFSLHKTLEKDLVFVKDLSLSSLFILPDEENPWAILVPKRPDIKEIHELSEKDQMILMKEITLVSSAMQEEFSADKMNIGALGNMVPQLHIHVICRFRQDRAWPGAIWGTSSKSRLFDTSKLRILLDKLALKVGL